MKILIADDEREMAEILKDVLIERGHEADLAFNGRQAIDLLQKKSYELLIVDHNMPEMTGIEVIKFIRAKHLPIKTILVSGYPAMKDFFAKALGADVFLPKPYELQQVFTLIQQFSPPKAA